MTTTKAQIVAGIAAVSDANDIVVQKIDALDLLAQGLDGPSGPPDPPDPPDPPAGIPTLPSAPVGPFVDRAALIVNTGGTLSLKKRHFTPAYTAVKLGQPVMDFDLVEFEDCTADDVGSIFYGRVDATIRSLIMRRIQCYNIKSGRPFMMVRGVIGPTLLQDVDLMWNTTPNTNTGDIPTGIQFGGKEDIEDLQTLTIQRMRVRGIRTSWPQTSYWNGDGVTAEATAAFVDIDDLTVIDCTDGAVDIKCAGRIRNLYMQDCRAAVKCWNDMQIDKVASVNPRVQGGIGGCSHFRLQGPKTAGGHVPVITAPDVYATGNAKLLQIENGPVRFNGVGTFTGPSLFSFGNGGSLAAGSTWNGSAIG